MGFGEGGIAVASHVTLLAVLLVLGVRVMRAFREATLLTRAEQFGLSAAISIAFLGLGIERAYYVAARLLQPRGLDLWSLHPAPAVLSAVVSLGLFLIGVPLVRAAAPEGGSVTGRILREGAAFLLIWLSLALVLP